jgi:arsenate reductase-like glutaredoxin family protein
VIQIFGRKKCHGTRKAQRFFKERSVPFHFVDIDERPPAPRELKVFLDAIGADVLIDTDSRHYAERGLQYMEFDPAGELLEDPLLLRTPIVRSGYRAVVGVDEAGWTRLVTP